LKNFLGSKVRYSEVPSGILYNGFSSTLITLVNSPSLIKESQSNSSQFWAA